VPGTRVLLADGTTKPIEEIQVGDLVWATDPETGEAGPRPVTDLITGTGDKTLVDITIDSDTITATDEHPFWVNNQGQWVDAEDLQPGDYLLDDTGITLVVDAATHHAPAERTVFNLTVDGTPTYHVLVARMRLQRRRATQVMAALCFAWVHQTDRRHRGR
jgi:hypothetical protein